jgi:hypothetical protein
MVSGRMQENWKSSAQLAKFTRILESESEIIELLDSQGWNQSLVVTRLAGARLAPQL